MLQRGGEGGAEWPPGWHALDYSLDDASYHLDRLGMDWWLTT